MDERDETDREYEAREEQSSDSEGPDMPSLAVAFPGPFSRHEVVVNGWQVPLLEAHMQGEDRVLLVIDQRLGDEFSVGEAERVIPFVADAIAAALGYGCHPRADTGHGAWRTIWWVNNRDGHHVDGPYTSRGDAEICAEAQAFDRAGSHDVAHWAEP